jgi:hypothetical protein
MIILGAHHIEKFSVRNLRLSIPNLIGTFLKFHLKLSSEGRKQHLKDRSGLADYDPGPDRAIKESVAWLCLAQDNSISQDGGVAYRYSLLDEWGASYPETTGYIVPTIIEYAKMKKDEQLLKRAELMLDWLASIQLKEGGFSGGQVVSKQKAPVSFNTGQILLGFVAGVRQFGEKYIEPMRRAADWLVRTQDSDGCWRAYPSPYAVRGDKTYDTHIAWSLLEAAKIEPQKKYAQAGLSNVRWALKSQRDNGWFANCCVLNPSRPLTHTLGYVFRGIVEAYQFTEESNFLDASQRIADGVMSAMCDDGFLPGRLMPNWQGVVSWSCLTGSAQIAYCWFKMYQITGKTAYRDAACAANQYVRRTMRIKGSPETKGAIGGSFPIYGGYCQYAYPNWACKFFIDSNLLEKQINELQ